MAASAIDELVVLLSLDPAKFTEGRKRAEDDLKRLRESAHKTTTEIETESASAGEAITGLARSAAGLFAVVIGARGIEQFTTKTTAGLVSLANAARLAGVSVQELSSIALASQRVGGDPAAAVGSIQSLAGALELWKVRGRISGDLLTGLNMIGGLSPNESAAQVYAAFGAWAKRQRDPQLVNMVGGQLGLDPGLIALATRRDANAEIGSARRVAPTNDQAQKLDRLNESFVRLRQTLDAAARADLVRLAPAMEHTITETDNLAKEFNKTTQAIIGLIAALVVLEGVAKAIALIRFVSGLPGAPRLPKLPAAAGGGFGALVADAAGVAAPWAAGAAALFWPSRLYDTIPDAEAKRRFIDQRMGRSSGGGGGSGYGYGGTSLSDRSNNALNIEDSSGHERRYTTPEEGAEAAARLLVRDYDKRGLHTVAAIIGRWSPANAPGNSQLKTDNYARFIADKLGVSPEANINLHDWATLSTMMRKMHQVEAGRRGSSKGDPILNRAAAVVIQQITIHDSSGSAHHIARQLGGAIRHNLARQSDSGLRG